MFRFTTSRRSPSSSLFRQTLPTLYHSYGGGGSSSSSGVTAPNKKEDPYFIAYDEISLVTSTRVESILNAICVARNSTPPELRDKNPMLSDWIACEKIHGSNFGLYLVDGCTKFRVAKRTAFIPQDESFFGYHVLLPSMERWCKKILALMNQGDIHKIGHFPGMKSKSGTSTEQQNNNNNSNNSNNQQQTAVIVEEEIDSLVINGELFGAKYKHPEVKDPKISRRFQMPSGKWADVQPPQIEKLPQYSNELMFAAFDIRYRLKNDSSKKVFTVNYEQTSKLFEKLLEEEEAIATAAEPSRLIFCKALLKGPLEELLVWNIDTATTSVPLLVGLGDNYFKNNLSEGIILRNSNHGHPELRTDVAASMLKYKNSMFSEMKHKDRKFPDPLLPLKNKYELSKKIENKLPVMDSVFATKKDVAECEKLCSMVVDSTATNASKEEEKKPNDTKSTTKEESTAQQEQEDFEVLKTLKLPQRLQTIVVKNGGVDAARLGDLTQNRAEYLLASETLSDYLSSTKDEKVVSMNLMQRREMARYLLMESKKVVAGEWMKHKWGQYNTSDGEEGVGEEDVAEESS